MEQIYATCASAVIYGVITTTLILPSWNNLMWLKDVLKMRRRLNHREHNVKRNNKIANHLDMLGRVVFKGKVSGGRISSGMLLIFIPVLFAGLRQLSLPGAMLLAVVMALLPIGVLELKLSGIRSRGSKEGESFLSCFLAKYRLANFNVYEAMADTASEKNNSKICCQQLYRLLLELRGTGDPQKIRSITERFSETIGTNWSRIFSYNLYIGAAYGINISIALEEILLQLRDARALDEERKRLNGEAARIVVFLIPVVFVATFFLNVFYLGMPCSEYIKNQFFTQTGLILTAAIVFLFAVNLAALQLIENHRFDY